MDVERPEHPGAPRFFNAGGAINDAYAVRVGMTNASLFAYVADGKNGLRVLQLTSPARTEGLWGFSPEPEPRADRDLQDEGLRRSRSRRASTATAPSMRAEISWPCSDAAARVRCTWTKCSASTCATASCTP